MPAHPVGECDREACLPATKSQRIYESRDHPLRRDAVFDQTWKWAGTYRKTDKNLGVPMGEIRERLAQLSGNAAYWLKNKTYDTDECAVRFHHELLVIHAFPNGNGRHARLIADVVAVKCGLPAFSWGDKELTAPGEARTEYLSALRTADKGDFTALLKFARA